MRKIVLALAFVSVLCAGLAAGPAWAISLGGIRNSLIEWVLDKVSVEDVFEITVEEVVGEDEGTTLLGVQIADAEGVWFTADRLTFDFNRTRLLRGQLVIDNLALSGVEVMRQPVVPPGEEIEVDLEGVDAPPDAPFIWPRSPLTTDIRQIVLEDVHLHEPVIGQDITFDATGGASDIGDIQSARLELRRTDEVEGAIDFAYSRDFDDGTLTLDLEAAEEAGGLVSDLAGLPPEVPVAVTLNAEGTPEAFNATFDLGLEDFVQAEGTALIDYAGPLSIDADLVARPGPLMPEDYAQIIGEEARLIVEASEGADQTVEIEAARIVSPYLQASASGTYARDTGAVDIEVELEAEPGLAAPFEGVEFAGLTFAGTVQGQPGSIRADGDLVLEGLVAPAAGVDRATLDIDVSQSGEGEAATVELAVEGLVQGLRLDQIGPEVIGDARLEVAASLTGDALLLETALIDSDVLNVSASGTADIATGAFDIAYGVAAPRIAPVLEPYGIAATGSVNATGAATGEGGTVRLTTDAELVDFGHPLVGADRLALEAVVVQGPERTTFDVDGTGEALRILELGPDLLDRADLALSGAIENEVLTLETARLDSPVLDVTADGFVGLGAEADGRIAYEVAAGDLAPVAASFGTELEGALAASGVVTLEDGEVALTTEAALTGFRHDLAEIGALRLEAAVDQDGERYGFEVAGTAEGLDVEGLPPEAADRAEFAAEGALAGQLLTLDAVRLDSPLLDATAEGRLDLADGSGRIAYDVDGAALEPLAALAGYEAAGTLSAEGVVELPATPEAVAETPAEAAPQLSGMVTTEDLVVQGQRVGDAVLDYDLALATLPVGTARLAVTDSPFALPDEPATLSLTAEGPPGEWRLDLDLDAPEWLEAEGSALVDAEAPIRVDAEFSARPGPKLPAEVAQALGDEAELVLRVEEGEDQTIVIEEARIASPALQASASGTYARDTGAADLEVQLNAEPALAAPFEGIEFGGLRFEGTVQGQPGSLAADGDLVLGGLSTDAVGLDRAVLEIDARQTGTAEAPTTRLTAEGLVTGLRLDQIGPETIGEARVEVAATLTGDELDLETALVDSDALTLSASGTADMATGDFDIDYGLAAPAIGPLLAPYGIEASGALDAAGEAVSEEGVLVNETRLDLRDLQSPFAAADLLHLEGRIVQGPERLSFDLSGYGEELAVDRLGPDLLGRAEIAASGAVEGDMLVLDQARIASGALDATAEGRIDLADGSGRIEYDVQSGELGPLAQAYELALSGRIAAEGVATIPPGGGAPGIEGRVTGEDLAFQGQAIGDVALAHDVTLGETPQGTLELALTDGPYAPAAIETAFRLDGQRLRLDGLEARAFGAVARGEATVNLETLAAEGALDVVAAEGPFAPAEARASFRYDGERLVLDGLRAQAFGLAAAGDIALDVDTLTAEGALRIDDADLTALGTLVGAPVAGEAQGAIVLSAEGGRQVVALDLDVLGLNALGVSVGAAAIDGRVVDALGTPRLDLEIAAERVVAGELTLATMAATAEGPLSALAVAATGAGDLDLKPLTLALAGQADLAGPAVRATFTTLEAVIGEDRFALLQPLTVVSRGAVVTVDDLGLALPDGGRLTGELRYFGGPLAGTLLLDAPDLSFTGRLFDAPIEAGALRVAATFDTRRGSAGADVTVTGREIVFADISGAGVLSVDASVDWNGRIADIDARVTGTFGEPLVVTASVPVRAGGALPELAESGPVSARVNWAGEIGDLWALVPAAGHVLTGEARVDLGVSGDISDPVFTGGILVADGVYQNLDFGTILTGVTLATEIRPGGALGIRLEATDGATGTVLVAGTVGLGDEGIDLSVEAREAVLVRREDSIARAAVDMAITGPLTALAVVGDVRIVEAEVRLVNANPPSIVTLGDVRIKGQPIVDDDGDAALPIRLEIDVVAPGRIFVRGRGLDSEWRMALEVRGTVSDPRIIGEIVAVRGGLDLLGKDFDLVRGRVLFNGGEVIDPRVDVVLERETADLIGRIVVDGFASDPQLSFSSTPGLPEDEVLPRVLFGKSSQSLTPSQGIQLALGLARLLDGGGGTLDRVRSAVGLDSLGIEQDDDGGAALAVGKQIDENIWLGTRQSLVGEGTSVAVEIEVFENITIDGDVSTDGDSSIGLKWRKDF